MKATLTLLAGFVVGAFTMYLYSDDEPAYAHKVEEDVRINLPVPMLSSRHARLTCSTYLQLSFAPNPFYRSPVNVVPNIRAVKGFAVSTDKFWCFSDLEILRVEDNELRHISEEKRWYSVETDRQVKKASKKDYEYALEQYNRVIEKDLRSPNHDD